MPLPPSRAEPDQPNFRNGVPVRMSGWLNVKHTRLSRKLPRFASLHGSVLSFSMAEDRFPEEEFDLAGALVDWSDRDTKKSFRLTVGRRAWICFSSSFEEMRSWATNLDFASSHSFHTYYTLGPILAEGTCSRIYYARPVEDPSHLYAVKVIKKRRDDVTAHEWVRRERHVNCVLNHPTIVQAVDMFSTVEKDHIVMELMRGGTLAELLAKHRRLPESYARVVMRQLLTALNHIHAKNIVHRDVRPQNIFCSSPKFPMSIALGDFGLANFISERTVNPDVLQTLIGVPPYIPIEVVRRNKYGPLADLWSAGIVLYEMLCGEVPFTGRSDRQVYEKIKKGVVTFDQPIWNNISPLAIRFIKQLLQPDSHKRISALAALQHQWIQPPASRPASLPSSPACIPSLFGVLADRDALDYNSIDSRRNLPVTSLVSNSVSNFSRNLSSTSSTTQPEPVERTESIERQKSNLALQPSLAHQSSLGYQSSQRSMHHVSSVSSMSGRINVTPSVRLIAERGLQRVASDNPQRMKRLLSSSVVQMQLSMALPYRRRLIVVARVFVAIFRLKALANGHSATRQLSVLGGENCDGVNQLIERRKKAQQKVVEQRNRTDERNKGKSARNSDRRDGNPLPHNARRSHHVRRKSREVAAHIIGRLSLDRFSPETTTGPQ